MAALQHHIVEDTEKCNCEDTVIVTGFGPFGEHSINASWEAVRLLSTTGIDKELNIRLITEEIPVSYDYVEANIPQLWNSHKPLLVIHVGVSSHASEITLEQVAQKSGYCKEDVFRCKPISNECCIGTCSSIKSTLDLELICNEINRTCGSIKTVLSENAGRYLCEYVYYVSLSIDNSRTVFIHVPPLDKPYSALQLAKIMCEAEVVETLVTDHYFTIVVVVGREGADDRRTADCPPLSCECYSHLL